MGLDQPEPLGEREQGATVAVPIWIDFMREALAGEPETTISRPDGIVDRLIDRSSGKPATPGDPDAVFEYFRTENAPELLAEPVPGLDIEENNQTISTETIF